MSCVGPCEQGRRECPHPELCEQYDGSPISELMVFLLVPIAVLAIAVFVILAIRVFA